jgi:hypothetical protein
MSRYISFTKLKYLIGFTKLKYLIFLNGENIKHCLHTVPQSNNLPVMVHDEKLDTDCKPIQTTAGDRGFHLGDVSPCAPVGKSKGNSPPCPSLLSYI